MRRSSSASTRSTSPCPRSAGFRRSASGARPGASRSGAFLAGDLGGLKRMHARMRFTPPCVMRTTEKGEKRCLLCRIHTVLVRHIEERLPKLREAVMTQELKARSELDSLGSPVSGSNTEAMREALLRLLDLYSNAFNGRLNGRSKRRVARDCMLQGGARIRHVFQQIFGKVLDELDPCCGMSDEEVRA
jgi:Dynamin central region